MTSKACVIVILQEGSKRILDDIQGILFSILHTVRTTVVHVSLVSIVLQIRQDVKGHGFKNRRDILYQYLRLSKDLYMQLY